MSPLGSEIETPRPQNPLLADDVLLLLRVGQREISLFSFLERSPPSLATSHVHRRCSFSCSPSSLPHLADLSLPEGFLALAHFIVHGAAYSRSKSLWSRVWPHPSFSFLQTLKASFFWSKTPFRPPFFGVPRSFSGRRLSSVLACPPLPHGVNLSPRRLLAVAQPTMVLPPFT